MDTDGTSSDFWELVELFYLAWGHFRRLHDNYEQTIQRYSTDRGVDRADLRLSALEVSGLFNFKALERLRDDYLTNLKHKAHKLFRTSDTTDTFDRSASELFHEVSILKEEHYTVKAYGPTANSEISEMILDEVHHYFPIRLNKISLLFTRANTRLESLFPQHAGNRILIRSLYIFGESILADVYPEGLNDLYTRMYPDEGAFGGYLQAGKSFFESGFWELAQEALEKSLAARSDANPPSEERIQQVNDLLRLIRLKNS
jgi:hypothetical protein